MVSNGSAQWRLQHTSRDVPTIGATPSDARRRMAPASTIPQTMCLDQDGDVYVANRGNENNFGMRVNHVKVGGPGEEELLAEFATYGEDDENCVWPFGVAVDKNGERLRDRRVEEHGLGLRRQGQVHPQVGHDRQRPWRIERAGRHCLRGERQPDRRRQRQQPPSGLHAGRQVGGPVRQEPAAAKASSTSLGASRSTRMATSTLRTGRTTACRSCRRAASS